MLRESWQEELKGRIRDEKGLAAFLGPGAMPSGFTSLLGRLSEAGHLPFATTASFLSLASPGADRLKDPILLQCLPSQDELCGLPGESADPLGEAHHRRAPRLIHQYASRILLRVTGDCPMFCRHCFRRGLLASERGFMESSQIDKAASYLELHPEVREVLVSGGDPLTASDDALLDLVDRLRRVRPSLFVRLCSRAPVSLPSRFTQRLLAELASRAPILFVIQVNHPRELSSAARASIAAIRGSGLGLRTQTVLLKAVNDDAEILEELFSELVRLDALPYYLFQGDLAAGTARFRVPLSRGLELYALLRTRLSGLELPRYALDAPGGGGKVFLPEALAGRRGKDWLLALPGGGRALYPEEDE